MVSEGTAARRQAHEVALRVDVEFPAPGGAELVLVALPRLAAHLAREAGLHEQHEFEGGPVDALVQRALLTTTGLSATGLTTGLSSTRTPVLRCGEERRRHRQRTQVGEQRT